MKIVLQMAVNSSRYLPFKSQHDSAVSVTLLINFSVVLLTLLSQSSAVLLALPSR
jgi:hypothetical protein